MFGNHIVGFLTRRLISSLYPSPMTTGWFLSELVGNPDDQFSHEVAPIFMDTLYHHMPVKCITFSAFRWPPWPMFKNADFFTVLNQSVDSLLFLVFV